MPYAAATNDASPISDTVLEEANHNVEACSWILFKQEAHAVHFGFAKRDRQAEAEAAPSRRGCLEHDRVCSRVHDGPSKVVRRAGGLLVDRQDHILRFQPASPAPAVRRHCTGELRVRGSAEKTPATLQQTPPLTRGVPLAMLRPRGATTTEQPRLFLVFAGAPARVPPAVRDAVPVRRAGWKPPARSL